MDKFASGEFDAVLNLLDRQVIDTNGLMVCKVDDLALVHEPDGNLCLTSILTGPAALLPRFSGHLGQKLLECWGHLGIQQADRTTPWCIDLDLVTRLDSAVHLSVAREGLLRKTHTERTGSSYRRLDHLLGMRVEHAGESLGHVLDVRVAVRRGHLECRHLIVGRGRPGSMLGYDRSPDMGPAPLSHVVRWLHRHTGQIAISDVSEWDWSANRLSVRTELEQLVHA